MYPTPVSGYAGQNCFPSRYGGGQGMAWMFAIAGLAMLAAASFSAWLGWTLATAAGASPGVAAGVAVVSVSAPWVISWVRDWFERRKARRFWASPEGKAMRQRSLAARR